MYNKDILNDKNILITGGGSGLGYSMALFFAKHGATVTILGRNIEKLVNAQKEAEKKMLQIHIQQADVTSYSEIEAAFDAIHQKNGTINTLVNNAAGNFLSLSEELSPNAFSKIIDIVLKGTFNCSTIFGKRLIKNELSGKILNISTTYASTGSGYVMPSACAKAGVEAMTKSLAYEWAPYQIYVNAVAPGPFPTKGAWERLLPNPSIAEMYKNTLPFKRFGHLDELNNAALFLISDLSNFINGEVLTVDSGEHLKNGQFNFLNNAFTKQQLHHYFNQLKP